MTSDPFRLAVMADGRIESPPRFRLTLVAPRPTTLIGDGTAIPLFWATPFDAAELGPDGGRVAYDIAVARLAARRSAWAKRASPSLMHGYDRFAQFVKVHGGDAVHLDLTPASEPRRAAVLDAVVQLLGFLAGADAPGPIVAAWSDYVRMVKAKQGTRLTEGKNAGAWPDQEPLYCQPTFGLTTATTGHGPRGAGLWPERDVAEDAPQDTLEAAKARYQASQALQLLYGGALAAVRSAAQHGNLQGIEWAKDACERFATAGEAHAASAPAFAEHFGVFDDEALWRARLKEVEAAAATLPAIEQKIRAAMAQP